MHPALHDGSRSEVGEIPPHFACTVSAARSAASPRRAWVPHTWLSAAASEPYPSLPPFAMCAAFPRSDYYGGSVLRPRHDRTCRPAGLRGPDARIEVPMFKEETLGAVGGRLYPWQRGPRAKSGHGGGVPISVHPVLLSVATELWLHTSHLRVQAPYREIQTPSSTRGVSPAGFTLAPLVTRLGSRCSSAGS